MATLNMALTAYSRQSNFSADNFSSPYNASQALMDLLLRNRFEEVKIGSSDLFIRRKRYVPGNIYYFRKHGECTISFLKDGRVHVLNGPIATWNLHDDLDEDELRVLMAFASLGEEDQQAMRQYMAPRCSQSAVERKYTDVMKNLPLFNAEWKRDFLEAYNRVLLRQFSH